MGPESDNFIEYAITITTHGRFRDLTSEDQFDQISEYIYLNLKDKGIRWTLLAELHKDMSTVHVHGIMKLDLNTLPRKYKGYPPRYVTDLMKKCKFFGFTVIKAVEDYNGWVEYILKNVKQTQTIINRHPLIIDDYNLMNLTSF